MMRLNKCLLQEMCQSKGWSLPHYSSRQQGPPHLPRFSASVFVHGFTFDTTTLLCTKKEAECSVAGIALSYFNETRETHPNTQNPKPTTTGQHYYLPAPPSQTASNPGLLSHTHKNETNSTEGKKGTHEVELILARERKLWQKEKDELENKIHLKSIELEDCHRRLQLMNDRAALEQKKVEEWILLAEGRMRETVKLQSKVFELEEHLARQAENGEEAQKKIQALERTLKEKEQELTEQSDLYDALNFKERGNNDELQGARKELIEGLGTNSKVYIGVKRCREAEDANEMAVELCSMWENYIGDSAWKPFKNIRDETGNKNDAGASSKEARPKRSIRAPPYLDDFVPK